MTESWVVLTSNHIQLKNMQRGSTADGVISYSPLDNAVVMVGDLKYEPERGARVHVVGNTVHIQTARTERRADIRKLSA